MQKGALPRLPDFMVSPSCFPSSMSQVNPVDVHYIDVCLQLSTCLLIVQVSALISWVVAYALFASKCYEAPFMEHSDLAIAIT